MREMKKYKQGLIFLIGFWFYTDGVWTIIKMATIFGREIGIGSTHLIGALLLVQLRAPVRYTPEAGTTTTPHVALSKAS